MRLHHHAFKLWLLTLVRRKGSLTAAALEAKLSTSAVSQALSQLEEALGVPLLVRGQKGNRLTAEADALLDALEPSLTVLDAFDPSTLTAARTPRRVRIGAYESIAIELLPRFVPLLRQRWPRMDVEIEIARSRVLLDKCRQAELDLVFVADATHAPNLHVVPYATDTYGVFVARDALPGSSLSQVIEAIGFGALKLDDKHHTRSFRRYLKTFTSPLRPTLETESFEVILALVAGGAIAGALPLRVASRLEGALRRLDVASPTARPETAPEVLPGNEEKDGDPGRHHLALACHESFSKPMFNALLGLARDESGGDTTRE
jgi:DNA-binding transcriptional LysR family regulator